MPDAPPRPSAPATPAAAPRRGFRLGLRPKFAAYLSLFILAMMGAVIRLVSVQQSRSIDHEVRERGLALARALSANSVEPLSVGTEATLELFILVKQVIQTSDDPAAQRELYGETTLSRLVVRSLERLGRESRIAGLRNEGVLFARIVDPKGDVLASADALKPETDWVNDMGKPYPPPAGTALLSPTDDERIMDSDDLNGIYVIAVPIRPANGGPAPAPAGGGPAAAGGTPAGAPAAPAGPAASAPAAGFMGTVYLGMSKNIVRRAVANAVARILLAAGLALAIGVVVALVIVGQLVSPIHQLRDGVLEVAKGNFNAPVRVRRRDELGELAASFNDMTKGLAERELIRNAFGAYVSSSVLDEILRNPEAMKVGGAKRRITMVDTDVRGFTAMSGKLTPEEVVAVVNAYLDVQAKIVHEFKGYVDRFVGDEMQAVFGVPEERPDDAERAVRCAWAIREAVARMIVDRSAKGQPAPRIGIGVDTGEVVAGNMGAQGAKLDYSMVGDVVPTAKALVEAARDAQVPGGQVVLSTNTFAVVRDFVEVRELGEVEIHGRKDPLRAYDLTGVKPSRSAAGTGARG